jgi:hypothetical protein
MSFGKGGRYEMAFVYLDLEKRSLWLFRSRIKWWSVCVCVRGGGGKWRFVAGQDGLRYEWACWQWHYFACRGLISLEERGHSSPSGVWSANAATREGGNTPRAASRHHNPFGRGVDQPVISPDPGKHHTPKKPGMNHQTRYESSNLLWRRCM